MELETIETQKKLINKLHSKIINKSVTIKETDNFNLGHGHIINISPSGLILFTSFFSTVAQIAQIPGNKNSGYKSITEYPYPNIQNIITMNFCSKQWETIIPSSMFSVYITWLENHISKSKL